METLGLNQGAIGVYIGAVLFGVVYNSFIAWMRANGHGDGLVSLFVAGGVVVTLILSAFVVGPVAAGLVALMFVCSGLPMMGGSLWRYVSNLRAELRESADGN